MKKLLIFIVLFLSLIFSVNSAVIINQSLSDFNDNLGAAANWKAQTFNWTSNFNLGEVGLNLTKKGTPAGSTYIAIRATASDLPTGGNLCLSTGITSSSIVNGTVPFSFSGCSLNGSTKYALVLYSTGSDASNYLGYRFKNSNVYANGTPSYSTDSGVNWLSGGGFDMEFYISTAVVATPILTFSNISLINNTYFNTSSININTTVLNTSTNGNVNQTYFIYYQNGTLLNTTKYATNSLTGSFNRTNLNDSRYYIYFFAINNETNVTSQTYNFTIDTIVPSLNVSIPSEYNYYTAFNFSRYINYSDNMGVSSCVVAISGETSTTCNNTNYNFTTNGNKTISITLTDLAGNVNSSLNNIMLINPYAFFAFNSSTGLISNYTFGGSSIVGQYANFTIYNDILTLGSNTLTFSKLGYATTNITFNVNTTSNINLTSNITGSTIVLSIYDRETFALINTSTTTVSLIATVGYNATTTTGLLNISNINFLNEDYTILASNPNYNSENLYFTYSNQETLPLSMYLLSVNATDGGYVILQVVTSDGTRINNAECSLLEWRPDLNSYISVAQGITNTNGEYTFNVEIASKFYKFSCEKAGVTAISSVQVFTTTGTTLPLIMGDTSALTNTNALASFTYSLTNTTYNTTHDKITYTFSDSNNLVTEGCLNHYGITGINPTLINSTCAATTIGQIILYVNINQTYNQIVYATAESNSIIYSIDSITFVGTNSLASALRNYHFDIILPLIFVLIGIVIGLTTKPANIFISYIGAIVGVWLSVMFVPTIISSTIAIFITLIALLLLWGGSKPK